jgi:oligoendopeptidase F
MGKVCANFCEELLIRGLMDWAEPDTRKALSCLSLENTWSLAAVGCAVFLFEKKAHERAKTKLEADDLTGYWRRTFPQMTGRAVKFPDNFGYEWGEYSCVFSSPYFEFEQLFGRIAALSLWGLHEADGPSVTERIVGIFRKGSSASPDDIMREAGFSIKDKEFWQRGFRVLNDLVDTL